MAKITAPTWSGSSKAGKVATSGPRSMVKDMIWVRHGDEIILRLGVEGDTWLCGGDLASPGLHFPESRRWQHGEEMK